MFDLIVLAALAAVGYWIWRKYKGRITIAPADDQTKV